jgi:hypothetical protein
MDTVELDAIEKKRREEGVPRSGSTNAESITTNGMEFYHNPRKNLFYRRPGHIASAGSLGLGVADLKRIDPWTNPPRLTDSMPGPRPDFRAINR